MKLTESKYNQETGKFGYPTRVNELTSNKQVKVQLFLEA
jgi:hypothetical protein